MIAISEYLLYNGFRFIRATVGGGVNEFSHTGDLAYDAEYSGFESFCDDFDSDFAQAETEARRKYGSLFSGFNYGHIAVEFAIKETYIKVILFTETDLRLQMLWSENTILTEKVNAQMKKILVGDSSFAKTDVIE